MLMSALALPATFEQSIKKQKHIPFPLPKNLPFLANLFHILLFLYAWHSFEKQVPSKLVACLIPPSFNATVLSFLGDSCLLKMQFAIQDRLDILWFDKLVVV